MWSTYDINKLGPYTVQFLIQYDVHQYDDLVPITPPSKQDLIFYVEIDHPCYEVTMRLPDNMLPLYDIPYDVFAPALEYTVITSNIIYYYPENPVSCPDPIIRFGMEPNWSPETYSWLSFDAVTNKLTI